MDSGVDGLVTEVVFRMATLPLLIIWTLHNNHSFVSWFSYFSYSCTFLA